MGQQARADARRQYCSNDIIPLYEAYYEKVLNATAPEWRTAGKALA
jgi:hypothetical protein